ncbi:MAG: LytTR family DNA-binding domain-containing protein [Acidobacteriota bacterium]
MNRLMVKLGNGYVVLKCEDIDRIESERNYQRLYKGEHSFLIRNTLADFEKKLDPDKFVRVNRSTIINIERIQKIESDRKHDYFVVMSNDVTVLWGRKFRDNLKRVLDN